MRSKENIAIAIVVGVFGMKPEGDAYCQMVETVKADDRMIAAYALGYADRSRVQGRLDGGRHPEGTPRAVEEATRFCLDLTERARNGKRGNW